MPDDEQDLAPEPSENKRSSMGPLLALVVLVLLTSGLAAVVWSLWSDEDETERSDRPQQRTRAVNLLRDFNEIDLGSIMANVGNEQGLRYCKVNVELWIPREHFDKVNDVRVRNIMLAALEERLHSFNMSELAGEFIHTRLRSTFEEVLNNTLRSVFMTENQDITYIEKVVLTNLLVQ